MVRLIPKDKMSKKAQKELNRQRRVTWEFSPVTRTVESRKIYSRRRKARNRDDSGLGLFLFWIRVMFFGSRLLRPPPARLSEAARLHRGSVSG